MPGKDHKQESRAAFDKVANQYDSDFTGKHASQLYDRVAETTRKFAPVSVLDVGCGTGNLLALLNQDHTHLYGVDLSPEMLKYARRRLGPEADLELADSEKLPWAAEQFDVVTCTDSFHHYPQPLHVLDEMRRVLKPQGHLIIGEPWLPQPFMRLINFAFRFSKDGDVKVYSQAEWTDMLNATGFALLRWEKVNSTSIILTAESNA